MDGVNGNTRDVENVTTITHTEGATRVRLSSEILERAATKDRPFPTYGTVTKVDLAFDFEDQRFTASRIREITRELHRDTEDALQEEIKRRADRDTITDVPF